MDPAFTNIEYQTATILSGIGPKGPTGDIYTYPTYNLMCRPAFALPRASAMVYGLNLTNEVFGYYTGSPMFVNQREYYKSTYAAGTTLYPQP